MTQRLDRAELISLLETLGSDNDEEALNAARVLDGKITAAGASWNELLSEKIGRPEEDTEEDDSPGLDLGDLGNLDDLPADAAARNSESLALIDKLLGKPGLSAELREELEDYKKDIAEQEFTDGDHRYIRALCKRLSA
jgi:hypothetical protein